MIKCPNCKKKAIDIDFLPVEPYTITVPYSEPNKTLGIIRICPKCGILFLVKEC